MLKETIMMQDLILLPGGKTALLRFPLQSDAFDISKLDPATHRLATHAEIIAVNSAPYPWGYLPENKMPTKLWKEKRIGYGGLMHSAWFILDNGHRIGGAPNVPETGPGAQRHYLLTTGGINDCLQLNENEGNALVFTSLSPLNEHVYRTIHAHVGKHVTADRGGVTISPISEKDETIHVGFVGRCMTCPNPERISIEALKDACPGLNIELHPDWKGWAV